MSSRLSPLRRAGAVLLAAIALSSLRCSKETAVDASQTNTTLVEYVSQVIGPAGGHIDHPAGASLDVPASALAQDTELKIGRMNADAVPVIPAGATAVSQVFSFEPHGQQFQTDVTIALNFVGDNPDVRLLMADPGGSWALVDADVLSSKLVRRADHFCFLVAVTGVDAGAGGSGGSAGAGGSGGLDVDAGDDASVDSGGSGGVAGAAGASPDAADDSATDGDLPDTGAPLALACQQQGGVVCTQQEKICPIGYEPVDPSNGFGCTGFCCIVAPPSSCSESGVGNCLPSCGGGIWWPVDGDAGLSCEAGRVCCYYEALNT